MSYGRTATAPAYAGGGTVPMSNYGADATYGGFNPQMLGQAGGQIGAGIGSGLYNLFGHPKDIYKEANKYISQIPGQLHQSFDPYIDRGGRAGSMLEDEYGNLVHNPGGRLNEIGQGYQQSPGFKFAMQQALQGSGHAAAAGGMAGSPQHEFENMQLATNLANQDYNNWIRNALGLHEQGTAGQHRFYDTGANAGMQLGQDLSSNLAQQAAMAAESANAKNQRKGQMWGNIGSGIAQGALAAFL
jgi:hypothetical protein